MKKLILILFITVLFSGCKDEKQSIVIKFGHSLDVSHPVHKAILYMRDRLELHSNGEITIDVFPNEQLGSEREMIELTQLGIIDMTKTSTSPLESFIPEMSVFSIPYVFRDKDHFWKVLSGPIGQNIKSRGSDVKLYGLCYYDSGSRSFYTANKKIAKPEDLRGLKIRVQQSNTAIEMVKALGGSPTPIGFGELYTSLQQGVVDGAENNPPSFETSRHYEICDYYTLDEHSMVPDIVIVNSDFWSGLTPQQKEMVQKAADESSLYQRQLWQEKTVESLEIVKKAGVEVIYPDKQPFIDAVRTMHDSYKGTETGEYLNKIKDVN